VVADVPVAEKPATEAPVHVKPVMALSPCPASSAESVPRTGDVFDHPESNVTDASGPVSSRGVMVTLPSPVLPPASLVEVSAVACT
jgi:hypothetical protein